MTTLPTEEFDLPLPVDGEGLTEFEEFDAWLAEQEADAEAALGDKAAEIAAAHVDRYAAQVVTAAADPSLLDGMSNEWSLYVRNDVVQRFGTTYLAGGLFAWMSAPGSAAIPESRAKQWARVVNTKAIAYQEQAYNRIVNASEALWSDVRDKTVTALRDGVDIPTLRREVESITGFARDRAQTIARTETLGAYNGGDWDGALALGEYGPVEKSWLATRDSRTRPSHVEASGQTVPLKEKFTVGGVEMDRPHAPGAPAGEVVNCRCVMQMLYPGDTRPDGSQIAPDEKPTLPDWTPPPAEFSGNLTTVNGKNLGGVHPKTVYRDANGDEFLFKPMDPWLAHGEAVAAEVALRAGLNAPRVWVHEIGGRTGTLQKLVPDARPGFKGSPGSFDPNYLQQFDLDVLQQHRVLDWLIGNHDAHSGQWIRPGYATSGVRVIGVDKGQAFKYWGRGEKLDYRWKPPDRLGDPDSVYAAIERSFAEGRLQGKFLAANQRNAVGETIDALQAIPDDELRAMLRPYAVGRWGTDTARIDDFIEGVVARKAALRTDLEAYHKALTREADRVAKAAAKAEAERLKGLTGRGGPTGMDKAIMSRDTDEFGRRVDHPIKTRAGHDELVQYTGSSYTAVNNALRQGKTHRLAPGISKSMQPVKESFIVHRGAHMQNLMPNRDMRSIQGSVFVDRGFLSTFLDGTKSAPGIASGDTGLNIKVPAGARGAWVKDISNHKSEREFLLDANSHLYVHTVRKPNPDVAWERRYTWILDVELVDPDWAQSGPAKVWEPGKGWIA